MRNIIGTILLSVGGLCLAVFLVPSLNLKVSGLKMQFVCASGSAQKCARLANAFRGKDEAYFLKGHNKACLRGEAKSCQALGQYFENTQQLDQALTSYQNGCDLKNEKACGNQMVMLLALRKVSEAQSFAKAQCLAGMPTLCRGWGMVARDRQKMDEAYSGFYYGCYTHKDYESCFQLGGVFFQTNRLPYATQAFQMACSQNHLQACQSLAFIRTAQNRVPSAQMHN